MSQSLQLNIIPFSSPVKEITLPFYIGGREGYYGLFLDEEVKELVGDRMSKLELFENKRIYTDFGTPQKDAIELTMVEVWKQWHASEFLFRRLPESAGRNKTRI